MPRGQLIKLPLAGGIDEKIDPKAAPPGTILSMVNARHLKTGRLEKRYGSTGGATSLALLLRLFARGPEQCAIGNIGDLDAMLAFSYSPVRGDYVKQDLVSECVLRRDPVKPLDTVWLDADVAYGNGLEVWCWRTNEGAFTDGTVYALVRDAATGAVLNESTISAAPAATRCMNPHLVVLGTTCIIWYGSAATGVIYARTLDLTNAIAGWGAQTAVRSDADVTANGVYFDVCVVNGNRAVLFYWSTQATKLQLYSYDSTLAQQANSGVVEGTGAYSSLAVAVDPTNTTLFVAMGQTGATGGKLRYGVRNPTTLASVVAMTDVRTPGTVQSMQAIGLCARTSTQALITGQWLNSNVNPTEGFIVDNTGAIASVGTVPWVNLLSRPFVNGSNYYQLVWKANQNTHYLVQWVQTSTAGFSPIRVAGVTGARIAHNASVSGSHAQNHLCAVVKLPVGTANSDAWISGSGQIADAASKQHLNLWRARVDFADRWALSGDPFSVMRAATAQLGLVTHISGGIQQYYDGRQVAETTCLEQIDSTQITLTPAGAGGGLGQGTYLYQFYWEWADAQGCVHRSLPSTPISATTPNPGTVNKVTCKVPTLTYTNLGWKKIPNPKPYLVICRTPVNGLSVAMYRVTMPDDIVAGALNLNDPTAAYITIDDTLADATLQTHPLLYTASGALENACPPSTQHICVHRNRLFAIADDGKTIWASTQFVNGEAIRFNDGPLLLQADDSSVALASLDDKLVIFGEHNIWIVFGDGPNELGIQSDWTTPQPVSTEVGCVSPHSVIRMSDGIYFQSRRGMYVLTRALELKPFKQPTDTLAANPVCVAVTDLLDTEAVMWALRPTPGITGGGVRLYYDDYHQAWSTDLVNDGVTAGVAVMALATFGGALYWATDAGKVFKEDKSTWLDAGVWFNASFEIQGPNEVMGFQRVRKVQTLGERFTDHNLKLSLAFDYGAYVQSFTWDAGRIGLMGNDNVQLRVGAQNGANPRCRALKLKVEILTPTVAIGEPWTAVIGNGQGPSFSGVGFEIVPKPSMPRLGAANASS